MSGRRFRTGATVPNGTAVCRHRSESETLPVQGFATPMGGGSGAAAAPAGDGCGAGCDARPDGSRGGPVEQGRAGRTGCADSRRGGRAGAGRRRAARWRAERCRLIAGRPWRGHGMDTAEVWRLRTGGPSARCTSPVSARRRHRAPSGARTACRTDRARPAPDTLRHHGSTFGGVYGLCMNRVLIWCRNRGGGARRWRGHDWRRVAHRAWRVAATARIGPGPTIIRVLT